MATDSEKNRETDTPQTADQAAEPAKTDKNAKVEDAAGESTKTGASTSRERPTALGTSESGLSKDTERKSTTSPGPDATDAEDATAAEGSEGSDDEYDDERAAGGSGSSARDKSTGGGIGTGATAVVSAGLGLTALVGSPLSEMMRTREEFVGQIEGGGPESAQEQIEVLYSSPWHLAALVNGTFGLVAMIVGGVLLATVASRAETRSWVKSVALGGVVLGAIGLLVSLGMYFDLFASTPSVPAQPTSPGP